MNTDLLKAFIAVADFGVLTEAAEKLHKTQSTVTKSIQRLEERLGGALFDRVGNRLTLNYRGSLLLDKALEVVRKEEDLISLSSMLSTEKLQTFTIAYDALIPFQSIAELVDLKCDFISSKNTHITRRVFDGAYKLVETGQANIGITAMLRESGGLTNHCIGQLDIVNTVVSKAKGDYWKTLPQAVLGDVKESTDESNIVSVSKSIRVESIEYKYDLILSGCAWGRVPLRLAERAIKQGAIAIKDAPGVYTRQKLPIYCVFGNVDWDYQQVLLPNAYGSVSCAGINSD